MSNYHNLILLTGAGFTKNFGGFLASEMWSQIYNHPDVQSSEKLRSLLCDDFDYESVYSRVNDDKSVSCEDKERIQSAVREAYKNLDIATKDWVFRDDSAHPVCWYTLNRLLSLFNSGREKISVFFTLNQDLFMERRSGSVCPGVPGFHAQKGGLSTTSLEESDFLVLPTEDKVNNLVETAIRGHAGPVYIKLHGSYGWVASDGSTRMVIGKNKVHTITSEPLLKAYFDLFSSAVQEDSKKMLIIGYGFGDEHINAVLADGVINHGLRIYVISSTQPKDWKKRVEEDVKYGATIISGLAGYYPYTLLEMFPKDQSETIHFKNLRRALVS
ncbi:hypothetical protein COV06_01450 [Candidatus Uhrbacteria bacterium CG10_big_fil_rev_8_21_14_0_10_50_16]|uniref:Uncharacterized protein n=1 Tax=Candidatus Uhrbacteria bacterium CG10_big_fil_rev_8_21_14_0_10_50_16 TaxID=1975039 RepID=A0A2H0RNM5_9BACT|nr:MAG: hypothetical protein COV06_01450 [Candidatus Uhrbacteria bacterium CG10_big_fil_rev_8_21_14_0_10_50_16]